MNIAFMNKSYGESGNSSQSELQILRHTQESQKHPRKFIPPEYNEPP